MMPLVLVPSRLKALANRYLSKNALHLKSFQERKKKMHTPISKQKQTKKKNHFIIIISFNSSRNIPVFGGQWNNRGKGWGRLLPQPVLLFHQRFPVD